MSLKIYLAIVAIVCHCPRFHGNKKYSEMFKFGIFSLYVENLRLMFLHQFSVPVWALISSSQFDDFN